MTDDRLSRLFIAGLRREASRRAIDAAIDMGVFAVRPAVLRADAGWMPSPNPDLPAAWAALRTGHAVREAELDDVDVDLPGFDARLFPQTVPADAEPHERPNKRAGRRGPSRRTVGRRRAGSDATLPPTGPSVAEREALVRAACDLGLPLIPSRVAALLLLAGSVNNFSLGLAGILALLHRPAPVVGIVAPVDGAKHFLEIALFNGLVPGLALQQTKASRLRPAIGSGCRREVVLLPDRAAGHARWNREDAADVEAERVRELADALITGRSVLALVKSFDDLPPRFADVADAILDTGPLTPGMIDAVIMLCRGGGKSSHDEASAKVSTPASPAGLDAELCGALSLADLDVAVRPGRTREAILADLARYAVARQAAAEAKATREAASAKAKTGQKGNKTFDKNSSGSTLVQPSAEPTAPHLNRLAGYGAAVTWARALGYDLAAWRADSIPWSDLSSKVLLHGPPGTGKTLFARALANTLQLPLLVSSVSTWLESGHLGDVLRRMNQAFAEAEAAAPSILFLDEIDGIGSRDAQKGREYDDYWVAVINSFLTLLDGAAKSEGVVIVGATNRPSVIDPAIVRSGRLETHIRIDRPDTGALIGILRSQIGDDLAAVVASAPAPAPDTVEADVDGEATGAIAAPRASPGHTGRAPTHHGPPHRGDEGTSAGLAMAEAGGRP